jgi:hypothetical protein
MAKSRNFEAVFVKNHSPLFIKSSPIHVFNLTQNPLWVTRPTVLGTQTQVFQDKPQKLQSIGKEKSRCFCDVTHCCCGKRVTQQCITRKWDRGSALTNRKSLSTGNSAAFGRYVIQILCCVISWALPSSFKGFTPAFLKHSGALSPLNLCTAEVFPKVLLYYG